MRHGVLPPHSGADRLKQPIHVEGLVDEPGKVFAGGSRGRFGFVVTAGEQDRDVGSNGAQKIECLLTADRRHGQVENDKRNALALRLQQMASGATQGNRPGSRPTRCVRVWQDQVGTARECVPYSLSYARARAALRAARVWAK